MAGEVHVSDDALVTGWGLVVEAYALTAAAIRRDLLARSGLDVASFEVLLRLSRSPGQRQSASQLAAEVSFSSGGFTKLADRMERAGLVERIAGHQDRRMVWVTLTPAGKRTIAAATAQHAQLLRQQVLAPLGVEDFTAMSALMRRLRDAASLPPTREPEETA